MRVPYRFMALQTFEEPELKSIYREGRVYTVRKEGSLLDGKVQTWSGENKVVILGPGGSTQAVLAFVKHKE